VIRDLVFDECGINSLGLSRNNHCRMCFVPQTVNCGMFCFWRRQSVAFCLCMKYLREPVNGFAPNSHGRRSWSLSWTSSKVKVTRDKNRHFSALLAACVQFMFGKTFLSCSCWTFYLRNILKHERNAAGPWSCTVVRTTTQIDCGNSRSCPRPNSCVTLLSLSTSFGQWKCPQNLYVEHIVDKTVD